MLRTSPMMLLKLEMALVPVLAFNACGLMPPLEVLVSKESLEQSLQKKFPQPLTRDFGELTLGLAVFDSAEVCLIEAAFLTELDLTQASL